MKITFPDSEKEKLNELNNLLSDWGKTISKAEPIKWREDNKDYPAKAWLSGDGFFPEDEIKLLDPDLIIITDLFSLPKNITDEFINRYIFKESDITFIKHSAKKFVTLYSFKINKKVIPLLDMYHFSSRGKSVEEYFYNPRLFQNVKF